MVISIALWRREHFEMRLFVSVTHQEIFAVIKLRCSLLLISTRELIHIAKRNFVSKLFTEAATRIPTSNVR